MIAIDQEQIVAIREVPRRLPRRPDGKCVHISAVYRWIQRGIRGVHLETIRIGGTTYTSVEALQRFADAQSVPNQLHIEQSTPKARLRQIDLASQQLHNLLSRTGNRKS
jgi:Protein of unknown function (DUF1580)